MDVDVLHFLIGKARSDTRNYQDLARESMQAEQWLRRVAAELVEEQSNIAKYRNQSVKQTLIDLANLNGGLVEIQQAVNVLLSTGGYGTRDQTSAAVRSAFYANKDVFENVDRGRYRLIEDVPTPDDEDDDDLLDDLLEDDDDEDDDAEEEDEEEEEEDEDLFDDDDDPLGVLGEPLYGHAARRTL